MKHPIIMSVLSGVWFLSNAVIADQSDDQQRRALIEQLKSLALSELIEVETFNPKASSAARKEQKLTDTSAALFVITQEDIRRSGITTLPEVLRLVPGVQVARINANRWAISIRGSNGLFASRLLVMIDGRSVYTLLRSEVNWDVQDVMLEDVDRIEVIRGPGASLWGANAVNGIINIITKSAEETVGNLLSLHAGSEEEKTIVSFRQGGSLSKDAHYRVYGKFYDHNNFSSEQGQEGYDQWEMRRGGFRADTKLNQQDTLTVQGDAYSGTSHQDIFLVIPQPQMVQDNIHLAGFNLLGRWERHSEHNDLAFQTYYDRTQRDESAYGEHRGNFDLDFQHRWQRTENQEYIWGLGYRFTHDEIRGTPILSYHPDRQQDRLYSAFVQGEFKIPLNPLGIFGMATPQEPNDWIRLTIGSKFEKYGSSDLEVQPTIRALWAANNQHSLWASISKAVRIPSRSDKGITFFLFNPSVVDSITGGIIRGEGNPHFEPEELIAYELGYRFYPNQDFLLDANLFYHDYDKLRTIEFAGMDPFPILRSANQMYGEAYGLELALHWQVSNKWKLVTTYNYLDTQMHLLATSTDVFSEASEEGSNPRHQATLRSLINPYRNVELDTAWYYVDNVPNQHVAHYTRVDLRLGWKLTPRLNFSVGGRNLFDKQHREFGVGASGGILFPQEIPRTWYLQCEYEF